MFRSSTVLRSLFPLLFHVLVSSQSYASSQIDSQWLEVFTEEELAEFFSKQPDAALSLQQNNAENVANPPEKAMTTTNAPTKYIYEHVIDRVDSNDKCNSPSDTLPVIVAVTNREALVGCHSFHQHLNPKWRTVFVLNGDVARKFGIDEMVKNASCKDTLGATLLMLDNFGGEVLGRRVALEYTRKELLPWTNIEFLQQNNCDVHPIPKKHRYHQSMDTIVTKMVEDFSLVKYYVENPHDRRNVPIPERYLDKPVLGMNAHLFEEFPSMRTLDEQQLHGHDVCGWKGVTARPGDLPNRFPWLCSNMDWTENHLMIFDLDNLFKVKSDLLDAPARNDVDSYPSSTKFTPAVAYNHGMQILINQDVYAHQNFARAANFREQTLPPIPNWLRVYSLETLAATRSPMMNYKAFHAYKDAGYVVRIGQTGLGFMNRQTEADDPSPWFPEDPWNLSQEESFRMIRAMMRICGYELWSEGADYYDFGIAGVYPADLIVLSSYKSLDTDDSWELLQLQDKRGVTYYYTAVSMATRKIRRMKPMERMVRVPKGAIKIKRIPGKAEPTNKIVIHNRGQFKPRTQNGEDWKRGMGECEVDDQKVITCCGYLNSPEFDRPY